MNVKNVNAETLATIGKLVDDSVQNNERSVSIGANLAVAIHGAIVAKQLDAQEVFDWLQNTDVKSKSEFLTDMCELYSTKFKAAQDVLEAAKTDENKSRKSLVTKTARRQIASARLALSRGLTSGYWLYKLEPEKISVTPDGALKIRHDDPNYDGTFAMNTVLKNAETKFKAKTTRAPQQKNAASAAPSSSNTPVTLAIAAKFLTDAVNGKLPKDFAEDTRKELQDLLVTLVGSFGQDDTGEMDMERIVEIYEADAA